jgi:hypothetical protein
MLKMNLILLAIIGAMVANSLTTQTGIYINTDLSVDERDLEDPQGVYVNTDSYTEERDLSSAQYDGAKNSATSDYTDAVNKVTAAHAQGQTDEVVKSAAEAYKIAAVEQVTAAQEQINQGDVIAAIPRGVTSEFKAAEIGKYVAEGNFLAAKGNTYERKAELLTAKGASSKPAYATAKTAYNNAKDKYETAKTKNIANVANNLTNYGNKSLYRQAVLSKLEITAESNRKRTEGLWAALA